MTARFMLDTNIASHIIKGDLPQVRRELARRPIHAIAISVITQAELLYGVSKRGHPVGLSERVAAFLSRVEVMPWTSAEADTYARLRATCEAAGVPLAPMDMMIAAHARTLQLETSTRGVTSVLVTRDKAFSRIPASAALALADWTVPDSGIA